MIVSNLSIGVFIKYICFRVIIIFTLLKTILVCSVNVIQRQHYTIFGKLLPQVIEN